MGLLGIKEGGKAAVMRVTKPLARADALVIEEMGDELLIYDENAKRAHCLGATATRVWRACDGGTSIETLASSLELPFDDVQRALDELERTNLLESQGLQVLASDDSAGQGITRRQLTRRSVQFGGAVVAAPMILSITAPSALATLTPVPFQCEIYTTQDCGASSGCGSIAGCCCCCQGMGSCKTCGATNFCNAGTQPCAPIQGGGFGSKCSDKKGTNPANPQGCCGISGATSCGCGFGTYAGCCDQTSGTSCSPGSSSNCYPCCAGQPLTSSAALGCCTSQYVNCCNPSALNAAQAACCANSSANSCCGKSPAACCTQSTANTNCCVTKPPACCATNSCP